MCLKMLIVFFLADISSSQESIGLSDVAIEVLHLLLNYLKSSSKDDLNIKPEEEIAFLDSLRRGNNWRSVLIISKFS